MNNNDNNQLPMDTFPNDDENSLNSKASKTNGKNTENNVTDGSSVNNEEDSLNNNGDVNVPDDNAATAPDDSAATAPDGVVEYEPDPLSKGNDDNAESLDPQADTEPSAVKKRKAKKKRTISPASIACVLSAFSIILLVALCISLLMGLIPLNGNRVVYLQVADGNSSIASGDASPETLESFMNSVVIISAATPTGESIGTGIVLSDDGYIVTNYHVIEDSTETSVFFYDDKSTPVSASLIGYSEIDDIAVIKVKKSGLQEATFASSANCKVGERVYAVGTPEGIEFGWSVTHGIISNNNRELKMYDNEGILEKKMYVLQTDTPVNPGNSGGPLINANGQVLGIITLKLSNSAGMGFAIPSDGALELIDAIIKYGNADSVNSSITKERPLMGITGVGVKGKTWYTNIIQGNTTAIDDVTEEYAKAHPDTCFYAPIDGVYVSAVTSGLDAANHLRIGDVITEVNGTLVKDIYDVMAIINELNGGDKISVKFFRNGEYSTAEITLGTQK